MKEFLLMMSVALIAVGLFILGLAITRIRKGRDLQSDVGSNDEMKKKGLICTSKAIKQEERAIREGNNFNPKDCDDNCSGCSGH